MHGSRGRCGCVPVRLVPVATLPAFRTTVHAITMAVNSTEIM
jgi:hypothetical protein